MKSLWLSESPETCPENPHWETSPFEFSLDALAENRRTLCDSTFFTVVRNPYVRILSAYFDKVARRIDPFTWPNFKATYGVSDDDDISFSDFMHMIAGTPPHLLDLHFAPQYITTLRSAVMPAFVGHLEETGPIAAFLSSYGVRLGRHVHHATAAQGRVPEFFTKETLSIAKRLYERDFETFGYDQNVKRLESIVDQSLAQDTSKLESFLAEQAIRKERDELKNELDAFRLRTDSLEDRLSAVEDRLSAVYASTSWQITSPLRAAATVCQLPFRAVGRRLRRGT